MAKQITHDLTYDAPASAVYAMLTDAAFREEVCDRSGVLRHDVTVSGGDLTNSATVRIQQWQSATGIPSFAKKLVGEEIEIIQEETWTSPTECDVKVTIPGKPGEMSGSVRLVEEAGATTEHIEMTITVRLPLVSGKVESLIADMLKKSLRVENTVGREYLAR
ncbi:DUF2505 family protein [Nocardioides sp. zg-579]|uniref:DUF2505 family protein n=1 Tax=Nocardioides marmotae TaxID=2663857 RepID=A0A6I3JAG0_9ACTN|nr:DUF2505 domain-containing protein [Nocardioides marmotae]MCR6030659.1 DUF2505 family protein [Gordonia jinghuaiqii]MTB94295.1 DUF2505 family protein [Nocardioides marmotae]QKE00570.1 DUF2505 domain-containing protein [Nocardioides marmotae]